MKLYHPSAHIVDNGKLCGMILHEGFRAKAGVFAHPVPLTIFSDLVKSNEVQLFIMGPNGPIIHYTDEEKKTLLRNKKSINTEHSDKWYYDNDIRFNLTDITNSSNKIAVSVLGVKVMRNIPMMYCAIYREGAFSKSDIQVMRKATHGSFSRIADNLYGLVVNPYELLDYLRKYPDGYGANFDNALHDNIVYRKRSLGFRNAEMQELIELRGLYDTFASR